MTIYPRTTKHVLRRISGILGASRELSLFRNRKVALLATRVTGLFYIYPFLSIPKLCEDSCTHTCKFLAHLVDFVAQDCLNASPVPVCFCFHAIKMDVDVPPIASTSSQPVTLPYITVQASCDVLFLLASS